MTRMFKEVTRTRNVITGCYHNCTYCYARKLIEGRLKNTPKYRDCGFTPCFHEEELKKGYGKNHTYFISDMGDMWGGWVEHQWIMKVLERIKQADKSNTFLFLTKNPARYIGYEDRGMFGDNCILGVTMETDEYPDGSISQAPKPYERYAAMMAVNHRRFVCIEPAIEFNMNRMVRRIRDIGPIFTYIGFDNHNNHLPEPSLSKTQSLIERLEEFTEIRLKTIREKV